MNTTYRPYIAELIGTFALVFVCAGAVCSAFLPLSAAPGDAGLVLGIVVAQGLILAVALSATINVSGGYLNPAVTITLWTLRRLTGRQTLYLLGAQLLGAVLAGMVLRIIFGENIVPGVPHLGEPFRTGAPTLGMDVLGTGALVELVLTFLLTFVIFGTVIDRRTPRLSGLGVGVMVGLALAALAWTGFRLTGASLNPARAFGPFLWAADIPTARTDVREHLFVYWIAPMLGALAAGWLYTILILPPEEAPAAASLFETPARPAARARKKK
jgi:aquaporin TIP